jgi:NhaP-type Na+/H+ or K+/H+ antiporter
MCINFAFLSLISIVIGVMFGLLASFVLKRFPVNNANPAREILFLILSAYLSYVISEVMEFSGIMTLFCCGMTMGYIAFYNMSKKS